MHAAIMSSDRAWRLPVRRVPLLLLGAGWAWVGFTKFGHVIWPGVGPGPATWASGFGPGVVAAAGAAEVACAWLILSGRTRLGTALALGLLAAFSIAWMVSPGSPGQPCGCGVGGLGLAGIDPPARNALLSGVHALALALAAPEAAPRATTS